MFRDTYDPVLHAFCKELDLRAREIYQPRVPFRTPAYRQRPHVRSLRSDRRGAVFLGGANGAHPIFGIANEGGGGAPILSPGGLGTPGLPGASPTAGNTIYEVVRNTSAAAVTPTQQGEYLAGMVMENGAINGSLQYVYDGVHTACFPAPSGGLNSAGTIGPERLTYFPMNFGPLGAGLTAAAQTFTNLTGVYFIMSNRENPQGHNWPDFRGVYNQNESSAASGVNETYTIPGIQAKPLGFTGLLSLAATATGFPIVDVTFPAIGNYATYKIPVTQDFDAPFKVWPVPDYDPSTSFVLVHNTINLGGATDIWIGGFLWY